MTDVTGFGLAGHLSGICEASDVAATLEIGRRPIHGMGPWHWRQAGSRDRACSRTTAAARGRCLARRVPRGDLLFDPQTAGGLLAAVDACTSGRRTGGAVERCRVSRRKTHRHRSPAVRPSVVQVISTPEEWRPTSVFLTGLIKRWLTSRLGDDFTRVHGREIWRRPRRSVAPSRPRRGRENRLPPIS